MADEMSPNKPAEEHKVETATISTPLQPQLQKERAQFRALILGNPNYFGTVKESPFKPVEPILADVAFEELKCVGFNPQLNLLEAVIWIKQEFGYGGDICSVGTPEYVRFYVDWDNTGNWIDQGMTSFTAHDIPGTKPLEYAVTLQINPLEKFCFFDNLPNVRAILSWNNPPPPNTPGFIPVWGNVLEARIQIEPLELIIFSKLLEEAKVKLPAQFEAALDLSQPIKAAKPQVLNVVERQALYKDKGVPGHRFAFPEVNQLITNPALTETLMKPGFKGFLTELHINLAELIAKLLETDGDTSFEELKCIGLNPNQDILEGILTVKLPNGYSGGPCTAGSEEYVAFWIDYGSGFNYVGTTAVNVHDFSDIPAGGLQYAVFLPVDFSQQRQPCELGAKTAKVRAILSWNIPPPPSNPNFVPTWGNREETLVQITPGPVSLGNTPFIDSVGNMGVCDIDQTTGWATGTGIIPPFTARESPFGGVITITGFILNPPNVLAGATPIKYKVYVRELGGTWQPLANTFAIDYTEQNGPGLPFQVTNYLQSIDPIDGYYTYLEQNYPNQWLIVTGGVLARWITGQPMIGLWEIKLEAKLPNGTTVPAGAIFCPKDGTFRSTVIVDLDEAAPTAKIDITGFSRGGGPVQPATDCGKFEVGDVIHGTYSTFDLEGHFNSLSLGVLPSGNPVNPSSRSYPIVSTNGEAGTWTLDTSGMEPCGYVVELGVNDRTIVSSGTIGWPNSASVGFCLDQAPPTTSA